MWPAPIAAHLNADKPMKHEWALWAQAKDYGSGAIVNKGLWTGAYDHTITLGGISRTYEGAIGGLKLGTIRFRTGTYVMAQEVSVALSQQGLSLVKGYNIRNAPCDLWCLCWDSSNMAYLGARRFFQGYIDGSTIQFAEKGEQSVMPLKLVSVAKRGVMTTVGYKSDASQKARNPNDDFNLYADLGTIAADPWGGDDD